MPRAVREHEVLRVKGIVHGKSPSSAAEAAREQILAWVQKRSGGRLPKDAWRHQGFEYLTGGRTSLGIRIVGQDSDIWAIRADDPDKTTPGRIWTTEVLIGSLGTDMPRLGVRLLVNTVEDSLNIVPAAPGFIRQVADRCGLAAGAYKVRSEPWAIRTEEDVGSLIEMLEDPQRTLPAYVVTSLDVAQGSTETLIDATALARSLIGLAHIIILPADFTFALTDAIGKVRSVFLGSVRAYMPGFSTDSSPYDHQLFLADSLKTTVGNKRCVDWLCIRSAAESLRRTRLGHDIISFAALRSADLKSVQEIQAKEGASDEAKLEAARDRISALEEELEQSKDWQDQLYTLHMEAEERAAVAEGQAAISALRIQQLIDQLKERGDSPDADIVLPAVWEDVADWCDERLAGRLVLAPAARRLVKSAVFEEPEQVARCLMWLATDCRDRRIHGGDGSIRDEPIEDGIRNAHCGGDAFDFEWRGLRLTADWHVKNGGNTRDPRRCLRIYYAWDPNTRQIVVAELPAHRRTGAT